MTTYQERPHRHTDSPAVGRLPECIVLLDDFGLMTELGGDADAMNRLGGATDGLRLLKTSTNCVSRGGVGDADLKDVVCGGGTVVKVENGVNCGRWLLRLPARLAALLRADESSSSSSYRFARGVDVLMGDALGVVCLLDVLVLILIAHFLVLHIDGWVAHPEGVSIVVGVCGSAAIAQVARRHRLHGASKASLKGARIGVSSRATSSAALLANLQRIDKVVRIIKTDGVVGTAAVILVIILKVLPQHWASFKLFEGVLGDAVAKAVRGGLSSTGCSVSHGCRRLRLSNVPRSQSGRGRGGGRRRGWQCGGLSSTIATTIVSSSRGAQVERT
ncbi:hypothetical protein TYRP_001335 [Tyrophagus putrescentiae]|nr:hypothetical protein TYRP_001335 [Tyrophagus putrescentiae]